jgi:hypothetical protein
MTAENHEHDAVEGIASGDESVVRPTPSLGSAFDAEVAARKLAAGFTTYTYAEITEAWEDAWAARRDYDAAVSECAARYRQRVADHHNGRRDAYIAQYPEATQAHGRPVSPDAIHFTLELYLPADLAAMRDELNADASYPQKGARYSRESYPVKQWRALAAKLRRRAARLRASCSAAR